MISAAAARMRQRYQPLLRDPNPDARDFAQQILRHVRDAERTLSLGDDSTLDPELADQTSAGGMALDRGDFARADRHYSAARRLAPNDAAVLAHLAWARFKNPEHKRPAREEEAIDLLGLAMQLDSESALVWRYKGEIARARGEVEAARAALQTSVRLSRR
jgi:tetratricopeptide (TPR) repeat protein